MKKQHIILTPADKKTLIGFLSKGEQKVRSQNRARALQMLDSGKTKTAVSKDLQVSYVSVNKWAEKYRTSGLDFLKDKPRSGRPIGLSGEDRAKVTALACSKPPQGYARWSLRLLSDRLVELDILDSISHNKVGEILKKTNFSLIEKNNGASES